MTKRPRNRIDLFIPAERMIYEAVQEIERNMPADTLLTEAQILLQQARDKVADYIDRVNNNL